MNHWSPLMLGIVSLFACGNLSDSPAYPASRSSSEDEGAHYERIDADLAQFDEKLAKLQKMLARAEHRDGEGWVVKRLTHMVELDQFARQSLTGQPDYSEAEALYWEQRATERMQAIDRRNVAELKRMLQIYPWITISQFGIEASQMAWLLVQHADHDPVFQTQILRRMEPLVTQGEVLAKDYAYLWDRVAANNGRPQRYGTQGQCVGDVWQPARLENPEKLDELRALVNLEPMANYTSYFDCGGELEAADTAFEQRDWGQCQNRYAEFASTRRGWAAGRASYQAARCAARARDIDAAFGHLTDALASGFGEILPDHEEWDILRSDPRWKLLLEKRKSSP